MNSLRFIATACAVALTLASFAPSASGAGTIRTVGSNQYGQLGDGTMTNRLTAVPVTTNVVAVAAGDHHSLFLRSDGTLWGMGRNAFGELGDGTLNLRSAPVLISANVVSFDGGQIHTMFARLDGTLWAMGANISGQLGDNSLNVRATPVRVTNGTSVASVSVGGATSMFVKTDGTLWGTGNNGSGQIGDGTNIPRSVPVQVATGVARVATGSQHTLFLKTDGTLWGMGEGSGLGLSPNTNQRLPVQLTAVTDVASIAAGFLTSYIIKTDKTLWVMGANDRGQLGTGAESLNVNVPTRVASDVVAVSTGTKHALFVKTDGSVWAMGMNDRGQLGDGTTTNRAAPVRVAAALGALVAAGVDHSVIADPIAQSRLLNLSTRGLVQSTANLLIPGFVVSGTANKQLLIRAVGPTLSTLGVSGAIVPDPQMTLKRLNTTLNPPAYVDFAVNDNWRDNANFAAVTSTAASVGAFPLQNNNEAALLVSVPPGQYTVPVGDRNGASGIAIVEIYDADSAAVNSRLINISNRGFCGVGDQVMIPGFVVSSEAPQTLLVRVVGPTLGSFGVTGVMANPKLELYKFNPSLGRNELIATQDNWSASPEAAFTSQVATQVGAFALPAGSADAAFVASVAPGNYTVVGSSADGTSTGIVLVEIYVVP